MSKRRNLKKLFRLVPLNAHPSYALQGAQKVPMLYKRADLSQWAREAFDKGEDYFYVEPVDEANPN